MSAFSEKCRMSGQDPTKNNRCFGKSVKEFVNELYKFSSKIDMCSNYANDHHFIPQWCKCDFWKDRDKWKIYRFSYENRDVKVADFLENYGYHDYRPMFETLTKHSTINQNKTGLLQELQNDEETRTKILSLLRKDYEMFFPELWPPL